MSDGIDAGMEVARIEIIRVLTDDGKDQIWSTTRDSDGNLLPLVESLGMLRMAEDSVIREAMGETPDDEDDED